MNHYPDRRSTRSKMLSAGACLLLLSFSFFAQAEESACPEPGSCAQTGQPTLRETLDRHRESLAGMLFGMQLSAFGDVASSYDEAGSQRVDWGTFELDAEIEFGHDLQGALALVNEPGGGTTLPVAFLDYHTFGGRIAPRGRLWVEKGFHLQAGRFDVPVGNDWQFFASKDSVSISRPLPTELVMEGGYNDKGLRILGNNGSVNFNLYLLRGFNAGRLLGGRLGLTPFSDPFSISSAKEPKAFEFGLSWFQDTDTRWQKNEGGYAVDGEVIVDDWSARFEYLARKKDPALAAGVTSLRGWHLTQELELDEDEGYVWPTRVFVRYDQAAIEPPEIATLGAEAGDARDARVAAGFRTGLGGSDVFLLKFEVMRYISATPETRALPAFGRQFFWFTQLVVML